MIEDLLTHDERLRLECLAQSNATNQMGRASSEKILSDAAKYERWVREGAAR